MRTSFLGFVLIMLLVVQACAKEPKQAVEAFLTSVQAGQIDQAYDTLFEGSGIPAAKPQAVDALKAQTKGVLPFYGKVLGFDLVRKEEFGASLVRLVYVLKQEKAPTVWQFYFYKPSDDWFLANVVFNDQFQFLERKD